MKEKDAHEWINKVLASAKGKEVPEASPFLFEKIEATVSPGKLHFSPRTQFQWALAATALLILNVGVILFSDSEPKTENTETYQELSDSYFQSDTTQTTLYSNLISSK